jgi:two-component system chemotaxis response regulator CheB
MPAVFTASLAEQLARASGLPVREAADAEVLTPGTLLIAPGGRHLTVVRDAATQKWRTRLTDDAPVHSCRPAADVLFRSVAALSGGAVLAVVLTGMGEDGAAGVAALKARPAWCIAQDQATCVVYGMPQAVVSRGLADEVLPLEQIAPRINALLAR